MGNFLTEDGVLKAFVGSETEVLIPSEVVRIAEGAFRESDIVYVTFEGHGLKSIDKEAFCGCKALKGIDIPEGTVQICDGAFAGCSALEYIAVPDSIFLVGEGILKGVGKNCFVIGKPNTEAAALAEKYSLILKPNKQKAMASLRELSALADNKTRKEFDIFGEKVVCSGSVVTYHKMIEYYAKKRNELFCLVWDVLPKERTASAQGSWQKLFDDEQQNWTSRLASFGVFADKNALTSYIIKPMETLLEVLKTLVDVQKQLQEGIQAEVEVNKEQLVLQAESKITGLGYVRIGGGLLDSLAYAADDARERKSQRKEAYKEANAKHSLFIYEQNEKGAQIYGDFLKKIHPIVQNSVYAFVEGLCKAEMDQLVKGDVLDGELLAHLDLSKSNEIISKIQDKDGDNRVAVALALKKYPYNAHALTYAVKNAYFCEGLSQLLTFFDQKKEYLAIFKEAAVRATQPTKSLQMIQAGRAFWGESTYTELLNSLAVSLTKGVEALAAEAPNIDCAKENSRAVLEKAYPRTVYDELFRNHIQPIQWDAETPIEGYEGLVTWFENARRSSASRDYEIAVGKFERGDYAGARDMFVAGYRDSDAYIAKCNKYIAQMEAKAGIKGLKNELNALYEDRKIVIKMIFCGICGILLGIGLAIGGVSLCSSSSSTVFPGVCGIVVGVCVSLLCLILLHVGRSNWKDLCYKILQKKHEIGQAEQELNELK